MKKIFYLINPVSLELLNISMQSHWSFRVGVFLSRISIFDSGGVVAPRSSACGSRAAVSLSKQRNKLYLCLSSHANHFTEIQQSL